MVDSLIKDITSLILFSTSVSLATIESNLAFVRVNMGVLMESNIRSEYIVAK